ncbi:MAG: HEAT repeat domain-containing protein, partial [Bacteroidia bacterium]|nr:HEAT repeat domain-containing protein [Bacteroidia bacterium]
MSVAGLIVLIFLTGYWTSLLINQKESGSAVSATQSSDNREESAEEAPSPHINEATANHQADTAPLTSGEPKPEASLKLENAETLAYTHSDRPSPALRPMPEMSYPSHHYLDDVAARGFDAESSRLNGPEPAPEPNILPAPASETADRIQAVYTHLESARGEDKIVEALIYTLNHDPNPNVRMAAIDALEKFADRSQTQYLIAQSLEQQASPTIQIATLDLIVK